MIYHDHAALLANFISGGRIGHLRACDYRIEPIRTTMLYYVTDLPGISQQPYHSALARLRVLV